MNKTFFLDIFNKILRIGDKDIFIIFDIKGEIWLSFKSLVSSLEYSSYTKQLTKLNIDKNFIKYYKDIKKVPYFSGVPLNFQNNTKFINESGLYQLLSHSTGATVEHINMKDIRAFKIYNLSQLTEQQTIVQNLEALLTETLKLEAIYQQKINDLEELKKSVLQKAFSGELKTTTVAV